MRGRKRGFLFAILFVTVLSILSFASATTCNGGTEEYISCTGTYEQTYPFSGCYGIFRDSNNLPIGPCSSIFFVEFSCNNHLDCYWSTDTYTTTEDCSTLQYSHTCLAESECTLDSDCSCDSGDSVAICEGTYSLPVAQCLGEVGGSLVYPDGYDCSGFTQDNCGTSWDTHGCHWGTAATNANCNTFTGQSESVCESVDGCTATSASCTNICSETDGGNDIFNAGTTTYNGVDSKDSCYGGNTVVYERYCDSNNILHTSGVTCPDGCLTNSNSEGYCASNPEPLTPILLPWANNIGLYNALLGIDTDNVNADCKYSVNPMSYDAMSFFTQTGWDEHQESITDLTPNTTYNYYLKCRNANYPTNSAYESVGYYYDFTTLLGSYCGDDVINELGEECDGSDLAGASCEDQYEYFDGTLSCSDTCFYDWNSCGPYYPEPCNINGILENTEACDGNLFINNLTCVALGYDTGTLTCSNTCEIGLSDCSGGISGSAYWMNSLPTTTISQIYFTAGNSINVSMVLDGSGLTLDGVTFTVYESDGTSSTELSGASSYGVGGTTGAVIAGFVISGGLPDGAISEILTINDALLAAAGEETNYEFYFEIEEIATGNLLASSILEVTLVTTSPCVTSTCCGGSGYAQDGNCYSDSSCETICTIVPEEPNPYWVNATGSTIRTATHTATGITTVGLVIEDSGLSVGNFDVIIMESDGAFFTDDPIKTVPGIVDANGLLTASWGIIDDDITAAGSELDGEYEFYFKVTDLNADSAETITSGNFLNADSAETITSGNLITSGKLMVTVIDSNQPSAYWADLEGIPIDDFIYTINELNEVYLVITNTGLNEGDEVTLTIKEKDYFTGLCVGNDDPIDTFTGIVNSNDMVFHLWTMEQTDFELANSDGILCPDEGEYYDFYFESSLATSGTLNTTINQDINPENYCSDIPIPDCTSYGFNQTACEEDTCDVSQGIPPPNCGIDNNCYCHFNEVTGCEKISAPIGEPGEPPTGWCTYNSVFDGNCTAGDYQVSYTYSGTWTWNDSNPTSNDDTCNDTWPFSEGECHYDPLLSSVGCEATSGSNILLCPAQIQLSFFSTLNLIAAAILLVIVYYLLTRKKKTKKVSKKKKH